MKTKIFDGLKTKFEGVEDSILERIANKLAKTVTTDEGVKTAIEGVTFQSILTSYGDSRANEAQASAVKNYETKHNLKDGKPVKTNTEDGGDDEPAWFKDYREKQDAVIKALKDAQEAEAKAKKANERLALINSTAKELGIPEAMIKHMSFAEDADIKTELTNFKQELVNSNLMPQYSPHFGGSADGSIKDSAESWAQSLPDK